MAAMILALVNNKGGVAKTTTAVNLAAGLARAGNRTLLVDLDSQASASLSLAVPRAELSPSSADVVLDGMPIARAARATWTAGLDLVTGAAALANADLALANVRGRERRLATALGPVRDDYGFIVLDCPPSLGLVSVNALVAADAFIVPIVPQYLALEGLVNLLEAVERVRTGIGASAELMGILLTLVDYRTRSAVEIVDMIRRHYGSQVFKTEIRVNVKLAEAPSFGRSIFDYDRTSSGALAYERLTREVLRRSRRTASA